MRNIIRTSKRLVRWCAFFRGSCWCQGCRSKCRYWKCTTFTHI